MANAELKDFADALLEGPAAAAAALEGTERREWEAKDRKAKAAMLLAVGEEYLDLVGDAATAREAWVALEGVAVGESKARRRTIAAEWAGISALGGKGAQRDSERIHTYVQRVKGVARELRNCGTVVSEAEELDAVLAGLHPRHNMLRMVLPSSGQEWKGGRGWRWSGTWTQQQQRIFPPTLVHSSK